MKSHPIHPPMKMKNQELGEKKFSQAKQTFLFHNFHALSDVFRLSFMLNRCFQLFAAEFWLTGFVKDTTNCSTQFLKIFSQNQESLKTV